jgi:CheY-like chemotaxis protein
VAHVLVVDDDEDIRLSMRTLLEDIGGHTVDEAANGLDALAYLRQCTEPLVVLLDLLMPGLDGIGVLQAVAQDEELATRHAYVLVTVSRRATSAEFPASLALTVPVIPKPFDINVLLQTVNEAGERLHGARADSGPSGNSQHRVTGTNLASGK